MLEVSIVIPVYNTGNYLIKAIDSCLRQTFKNLEIIIINDGSTDNSLQIALEYEARNNNIRVITTENRGLSEARNKGLDEAQGRYVYFLDSDDWIEPQTIEYCYKQAVDNELEIVLFDSKVEVDMAPTSMNAIKFNNYIRNHIVNPNYIYSGRQFIEAYSDKGGVLVQAWLVFTKREFLLKNNIKFLSNAYYEDVAFNFSCMMMAERIMYIPQAFHVRLYREGSIMTTSLNTRKICSVYEITKEMYSALLIMGKQDDSLWIRHLLREMYKLYRAIFLNVSRRDYENAKAHTEEILRHQRDVIVIYYKLLNLIGEKPSNVRRTMEFINEVVTPFGWISEEILDTAREITSDREKLIGNILSGLPFNKENIRVGVYGSGKHAEYILNKYREILGDIKAELVFIDTYKKSFSEKIYDYDIINVDDLDTMHISEIVILSYLYEEEMYSNLVKKYGSRYKIHRIYKADKEPIDSDIYMFWFNRLQRFYEHGRKRIVLINTPLHTNIGDHMIAIAAKRFFADFLPDYDVTEVTNKTYKGMRTDVLYRTNKIDDIIVITGGGFLGSLWPSGQNVYSILKDFPDNKILILPQSMYFEDNEEGEKQRKLFYDLLVDHNDIAVLLREHISYNRFEAMFKGRVKGYLMPDMALTLNYSHEQKERKGILLCLRNDKESILSEDIKTSIKAHFLDLGQEVSEGSMHWHTDIKERMRNEVIAEKINEFKKYSLVITDTLHCMISCAIGGTPCIAINNINKKIEGIYKSWLYDLKYIRYVDKPEDIMNMDIDGWEELYRNNYYDKDYSDYLKQIADLLICNEKE